MFKTLVAHLIVVSTGSTTSTTISGASIFNGIWNLFLNFPGGIFSGIGGLMNDIFGGIGSSIMQVFQSWGFSDSSTYRVWAPVGLVVTLGAAGFVIYIFLMLTASRRMSLEQKRMRKGTNFPNFSGG